MGEKAFDKAPEIKSCPSIRFKDFGAVEAEFLSEFEMLTAQNTKLNFYFPDEPFLSVGIDGCAGKWVAVGLSECGFEVSLHKDIAEVCEKYDSAHSIIVDMPIGLSESPMDIRPDGLLRKNLKGKASSVFNTPCRQAVYAPDYTAAIAENKRVFNQSISPSQQRDNPEDQGN